MPSTPQVVPTALLFDYEFLLDGTPLIKGAVEVQLNAGNATVTAPQVLLESKKLTATTDSNGYWQVALVRNSDITPTGTKYMVKTPMRTFQVSVPAGAGPFQASLNTA